MNPAIREAVLWRPTLHDGISLNFQTGQHYVKAIGGVLARGALTDFFTFTGGNQSRYMGPAGLLVASATNTPRIEYDASGNCLGLLMEAARTNLGLHSDDHTNAAWVKTNMTTAKTSTGPDGVASSATRLTASAGNATSLQTVTSASATRAYSVWMRRITGSGNIQMTLDNGAGWTTKTLTTSWQRFDITQAAVTNPVFGIRIVTSGDAIDVYGNQLESAGFASSLIPTTTGSVARTVDSCIRTLGAEFSATAGTVVVAGRASGGQDASAQGVWAFGVFPDVLFFQRQAASDTGRFNAFTAGAAQSGIDGTFTNSTPFKSAVAYATNDCALSFNGGAIVPDASVALSGSYAGLYLGMVAGFPMNGHIRAFDYYPSRLSNADLVRLAA